MVEGDRLGKAKWVDSGWIIESHLFSEKVKKQVRVGGQNGEFGGGHPGIGDLVRHPGETSNQLGQ